MKQQRILFSFLVASIFFYGCSSSQRNAVSSGDPGAQVIVQYIGHSSVLITAPDGTRLVTDPYGSHPDGLPDYPKNIKAAAVVVSHFHSDHSNTQAIQGSPKIIYDPGSYQAGMIKITGYKSDHGVLNGNPNGDNTVFVFEIGDVRIVHFGAAGIVTQPDIIDSIKNADLAIIDIHGDGAHPGKEMISQMKDLDVHTIIPTHYSMNDRTPYYGGKTLDDFLKKIPGGMTVTNGGSEIRVFHDMPEQILVLQPSVLVK